MKNLILSFLSLLFFSCADKNKVSYNLPSKVAKKISADNISISFIGRNFLIWTPKENAYVDPEATNLGNDFTGEFGEFATSPSTKSYGFSVKIGFLAGLFDILQASTHPDVS